MQSDLLAIASAKTALVEKQRMPAKQKTVPQLVQVFCHRFFRNTVLASSYIPTMIPSSSPPSRNQCDEPPRQ